MTTAPTAPAAARPPYWQAGDWNALFGFGTNILVNVLVLTGLLRFVLLDCIGRTSILNGPEDHLLFTAYSEIAE